MEALNFVETLTVEQFKNKMMVESISVKKNPKKGGSIFMTYGSATGMVARKVASKIENRQPLGILMISHVTSGDTDCWMLHEEGQGAPTLATF